MDKIKTLKNDILTLLFLSAMIPETIFAACPAPANNVYTAVNASQSEVQSCIDAAIAGNGGTVKIPAGTYTWTSSVTKTITKNIVISGAGQSEATGTVIKCGTANTPAFSFRVDGTTSFVIKDMRVTAFAGSNTNAVINIRGTSLNKLINNIYFDFTGSTGGRLLILGSYSDATHGAAVVSGCTFYNPINGGQGISIFGNAAGSTYYWTGNPQFGTENAYYIENNTFNFTAGIGDGAFDAYAGARAVFRYNLVIGTVLGWHGNDSSTSAHSFEIYKNTFQNAPRKVNFISNARGGTAIIYDNVADATYSTGITLSNYRSCQATGRDGKMCQGSGDYDANSDASGYRCYQQIGSTGTDGTTQWPIIAWNNQQNGSNNIRFTLNGNFVGSLCGQTYDMTDHVKAGRDYIDDDTCNGISSAFCSKWWDDVNKKGKLNGSNYTPLEYPHPLISKLSSSTTYTLSVTSTNGTVTSSPVGIDCGLTCSYDYESGTSIILTATPGSGYAFSSWSGACTGTTSTCQVTMDAAKNVIASFMAQETPALITSKKGTGKGKIKSISAVSASNIAASNAIDCGDVCVAQYDNATKVTLTAEPEAGSTFSGWEGACSGTGDCVVTVNSLTSVIATFSLQASGGSPTTMLSVSGDGGGGGGGCFIATAAFGSYLDPHVMALREFRDKMLMNYELGRAFVRFYYKYSPAIANIISQNDTLTFVTRLGLTPFIYAVAYPLATAAALLSLILVLLAIKRKKTAKPASMMANVYFQKRPRRGLCA